MPPVEIVTFEYFFDPLSQTFLPDVQITFDQSHVIQHIELNTSNHTNYQKGFYVPGFINMHAHLEYSWMKGVIPPFKKMPYFIDQMKKISQTYNESEKNKKAKQVIEKLKLNGAVHVVDICNSFLKTKTHEPAFFTNLIEIFGLDPQQSLEKIELAEKVFQSYLSLNGQSFVTPHSLFSLSDVLWDYVLPKINEAPFYSIHFMESRYELDTLKDPVDRAVSLLPKNKRVLFVHNTYTTERDLLRLLDYFTDPWFVFCPRSNYYIEKKIPPIEMFLHYCPERILLGTDSLASNWSVNLWDEILFLRRHFPDIQITYWIKVASHQAAKALFKDSVWGSLREGTAPGVHAIPVDVTATL